MAEAREGHKLGFAAALALVLGSIVGSGILILPGLMLAELPVPGLVLGVLVVGGLVSVAGCLVFAELAGMFPRSGGQVHYLREGVGPLASYLFGWSTFWLILTGLAATLAAAFASFVGSLVPLPGTATPLVVGGWATGLVLPAWGNAWVAIGALAALGALNALGLRFGGWVSNVATAAKVVGLGGLVVLLLLLGPRPPGAFVSALPADAGAGVLVGGLVAAFAFSLFAYDGWAQATFVAGEVREPRRTVPRILLLAPLLAAALYVLLAAGYAAVMSTADAAAIGRDPARLIAVEAARRAAGDGGAVFLAVVATVAVFGTLNAFVLGAPRVFQAMGEQGILHRGMARRNRRGAPQTALMYTVLWAGFLVVTGIYEKLVYMVTFAMWLFYLPTAVAFLRLRRLRPEAERPFRAPAGRAVAGAFLATGVFVVVALLGNPASRAYAVLALLLVAAGAAGYWVQRRHVAPGPLAVGAEMPDEPPAERAPG